ncbi:hypothetical protein GLOIN_2v1788273 [Rhizophagus irregularis DAOM 181602=DAOM 197198]|uniref:Uncharacterized protein n=1 Tax=Rhizophagus irregularis (strain DAOM 181602 / DAOM 197198 / MUCL 43194) TaxID=747089 RepID=A0A2P4P451_RHIID|nr:hypothetical protein GLOIN_2v1788273 [Rhizophagus irregularis DAOM 181602=DAOM 197198]POG60166.1 hypothetical protein GLOIN_2v1788273 [Rhizophagus irregularis DAOM 181602=DAOM 197198]|eukprot:XP_025167032.1 hypothetical protein GLOIN_2v1788273 [Rhizophagus irregularis DAOM 181602=DAOM 197198]
MKCSPDEDDEEIKIDLKRISDKLLHKLKVKKLLRKKNGLKYDNIYELLALFSIIVFKQLNWPCLYSTIITIAEWKEITRTNPYTSQDSPLSRDILLSLYDVSFNHFLELDLFVKNGELKLSKIVMFKDVRLLKQFSSSSKPD